MAKCRNSGRQEQLVQCYPHIGKAAKKVSRGVVLYIASRSPILTQVVPARFIIAAIFLLDLLHIEVHCVTVRFLSS